MTSAERLDNSCLFWLSALTTIYIIVVCLIFTNSILLLFFYISLIMYFMKSEILLKIFRYT